MIVNTRPLALSDSIKEIELKEKIDIRHIHLTSISQVQDKVSQKKWFNLLVNIDIYKNIIFTSRSAVKFGMQLVPENKLKTFFLKKIYAIGPATGSELIKHNVKPIIASNPNSESLAEDLNTNNNDRSLIFCGTNTRGHLQNELKNIDEIKCYELTYNEIELSSFNKEKEVVLIYNFKTLEFILNNIDEEVIKEKIFVMSSQRILDAGKDIQNLNGIVANDASDKSMIDAAKNII
jgi:uroporphyrinogen-III synthase